MVKVVLIVRLFMYTRSFERKRAGAGDRKSEDQDYLRRQSRAERKTCGCCGGVSSCVWSGCCDERLEKKGSCCDGGARQESEWWWMKRTLNLETQ